MLFFLSRLGFSMQSDELKSLLQNTLDDFRLSRTERQALGERIAEMQLDESMQNRCFNLAFELANDAMDPSNPRIVMNWLEEVTKVLRRNVNTGSDDNAKAYFSPGNHCWSRICELLRQTHKQAEICVFTITDDRISDEILATYKRGVAIRVISDNEKAFDLGSDVERLSKAGVPVRIDRTSNHMHHKFALFDRKKLLTGSYNWTRSAAKYNEENLVVTEDRGLIEPFVEEFEKLWGAFASY